MQKKKKRCLQSSFVVLGNVKTGEGDACRGEQEGRFAGW